MIERTEECFDLKPNEVAGDVAYGTGGMLGWLVGRGIDPHIPVWDKSERKDGTLSRKDFDFDAERDVYTCPQGKTLKTTGRLHHGKTLRYRSSKYDCDVCPLKPRCCPNSPERKVLRDVNEDARDRARALMGGEANKNSGRQRKKIERLFGDVKRNQGLTRLRPLSLIHISEPTRPY